jgi:tetratricopeptide (TPR) repeat protein
LHQGGALLAEADAAYDAKDHAGAAPLYEEALAIRPGVSARAYLRLADSLEALGCPGEAREWLERGRDRTGGDAALLGRLSRLYESEGRVAPALACAEAALSRAPGDPEAQRDAERLRAAFQSALRKSLDVTATPDGGGAGIVETFARLERLLGEGRSAEAVSLYEVALAPLPEFALHLRAGERFAAGHLEAEAGAAYRRALQLAPRQPEVFVHLGDWNLARQRPDEAASWYRRGLEVAPGDEALKARLAAAGGPGPD